MAITKGSLFERCMEWVIRALSLVTFLLLLYTVFVVCVIFYSETLALYQELMR